MKGMSICDCNKGNKTTHPRIPRETSLTQSSLGRVLSSCGGRVEGRYSISRVTSSDVPELAQ